MKKYDVLIIGGGPAGMMAAISAAINGKSVILLEKNEGLGKKLLATGNGRCNITNANVLASNFYGSSENFFNAIYSQFNNLETIKFFESIGLILKEEERGRIFPITNQASSVLEALIYKMRDLGVEIKTKAEVKKIIKKDFWEIILGNGLVYHSANIVLTTGGKAAFQFGSSGDGLFWAKNLGHDIVPISSSLVPLETKEEWPKKVQGLRVDAGVNILVDSIIQGNKRGDFLFTHFGVSGPTVLGLSRIASTNEGSLVELLVDFFPNINEKDLDAQIEKILSASGAKNIKNSLTGVIPLNLIPIILNNAKVSGDIKAAEVSKSARQQIISELKRSKLTVLKTRPLKEAQVSAGGISEKNINPLTLESKVVKNLFFAGEIINVDGDSGGFNLQWAWSSGYVAGKFAADY
jgi:predicted Rossmann fold flavoprotein